VLDVIDRDRESEAAEENVSHVGHADHLAGQIEQRTAGVAGIDVGVGLDICDPFEGPVPGANDAVGDGPLEAHRVADCEDVLAGPDAIDVSEIGGLDLRIADILDFQQRQIDEGVHCFDFDLLELLLLEAVRRLEKHSDFDLCLPLDDVKVGYQISPFVNEKARTRAARAGDHHHRFRDRLHAFLDCSLPEPGG